MTLETLDDLEVARARLRRRDGEILADFVVSLAILPGPIAEHVLTFIAAEDLEETVASVRARIQQLDTPSESEHRQARGRDMGMRLNLIVESVER